MSPALPFTNVTPRWLGSDGRRALSPSVAQRPTADRGTPFEAAPVVLPGSRQLWLFSPKRHVLRYRGSQTVWSLSVGQEFPKLARYRKSQ